MPTGVYCRSETSKTNTSKRMMGNDYRVGKVPWNKGIKTGPLSEETKQKLSDSHLGNKNGKGWVKGNPNYKIRGSNHYCWKGGIAKEKRTGFEYDSWRISVFKRDDWTCQNCTDRGCYLEAHHVKSWAEFKELRYDINNGVTLCKKCHSLTENYKGKNRALSINNSDQKVIDA